jgi:hypothetical protein
MRPVPPFGSASAVVAAMAGDSLPIAGNGRNTRSLGGPELGVAKAVKRLDALRPAEQEVVLQAGSASHPPFFPH